LRQKDNWLIRIDCDDPFVMFPKISKNSEDSCFSASLKKIKKRKCWLKKKRKEKQKTK